MNLEEQINIVRDGNCADGSSGIEWVETNNENISNDKTLIHNGTRLYPKTSDKYKDDFRKFISDIRK